MKLRIVENIVVSDSQEDGILYIYENPTLKDLNGKNESRENRGVIDHKGYLYVESFWSKTEDKPYSFITHVGVIRHLHKKRKLMKLMEPTDDDWYYPEEFLRGGVCVQRYLSTNEFYLAESYVNDAETNLNQVRKFYKLAKKVNPKFLFKTQKINHKRFE
jgi:hypothetical protein